MSDPQLRWFRLYSEFLTDPIVRLLAFEDQRHFIAALCMKSMGVLDKQYARPELRTRVISSLVGLSDVTSGTDKSQLDAARDRLRDIGLIDEGWQPINWNKRQFQSDSSAERTRKWRLKRHGDVTVTRQSRAETEQIQNRTEQRKSPPVFLDGLDRDAFQRFTEYRKQIGKPIKTASLEAAQKALAKFGADQAAVVEQSVANGWQGLFALKTAPSGNSATRLRTPEEIEAEAFMRAGVTNARDYEVWERAQKLKESRA